MAAKRILTFRIQGIPLSVTDEGLRNHLNIHLTPVELADIQPEILIVPSSHSIPDSKNALVRFHPHPPAFLESVQKDRTGMGEHHSRIGNAVIRIDFGFLGLTQISDKSCGESNLDIVFVTGIDGNAYGSWASRKSGVMWPRDFLIGDLPTARVLTYGYNTKLSNAMAHTFDDFCTDFLAQLNLARSSDETVDRPLILIGHSYGARLITKSLVKCKIRDSTRFHRALLASLKTIVFFGAPHRGMDTTDIERYLGANSFDSPVADARQALVAELRRNNTVVERELQDFKDLVGDSLKIQIISVYERKPSQKLVPEVSSTTDGSKVLPRAASWKRNGEPYVPLDVNSALLGFPASMEIRVPSDSDHSNMAKFDHRDDTYYQILHELRKAIPMPVADNTSTISSEDRTLINERRSDSWGRHSTISPSMSELEPQWLSLKSLYFPSEPELESDRVRHNWLDQVLSYFSNATELSLKPRRFGILEKREKLEKVMVEFRPYPNHEEVSDYLRRREGFVNMARIILRNQTTTRQFSAVPLRGISIMNESNTPCFLFVYGAENLLGLDEALQTLNAPTFKERLWLALEYAKAINALHCLNICHGLINPYNLYLQLPTTHSSMGSWSSVSLRLQQTVPMLAGFDIARETNQMSDLIDVEDQDWRVYMHKDRLSQGTWKERQVPEHDIFSLGMVLIVIGLWMPFGRFKKYQEAANEDQRRDFSMKLRKHFSSSKPGNGMPSEYQDAISYCFGKQKTAAHHGEVPVSKSMEPPSAAWVVNKLTNMLQGGPELSTSH
ncbi:hypothetical protein TARUN_6798 [Trichoderma arundinaceum]|uniref:Protein kinase domain-containing protein n=1 Tax=Trichoderma arundinaceum TaxID=490622 RepID=A0A395NH96_TRIAR|nr:hypothetical protein TARUN_6798 [Trichoderma arundinaceum]